MAEPMTDERIKVFIEDHTSNKRREARIAANAAVRELIPALTTAMGLPATDPAGRPLTYHLVFEDQRLQNNDTLTSAGVVEGNVISLQPEMVDDPTVKEFYEILEKMNLESLSPYGRHLQQIFYVKFSLDIQSQSLPENQIESLERALTDSDRQLIVQPVLRATDLTNLDSLNNMVPLGPYLSLLQQIGTIYQNRPEYRFFIQLVGLIVTLVRRQQSLEMRIAELEKHVEKMHEVRYTPESDYPVSPGRVIIKLRLSRDIESFREAEQREWIREIAAVTGTPERDIVIRAIARGSVWITLEVPDDAAAKIIQFCCPVQSSPQIVPSVQPPYVELESPAVEIIEQATVLIKCNNRMQVSFEIYRDTGPYFPEDDGEHCLNGGIDNWNRQLSHIGRNIQTYRANGDREAQRFWRESVKRLGTELDAQIFNHNPDLMQCLGEIGQKIKAEAHIIFRFVGPRWHLGMPYELLFRSQDSLPLIVKHPVCRQVSGRAANNAQGLGGVLRRLMSPSDRSSVTQSPEPLKVLLIASSQACQEDADNEIASLQQLIQDKAEALKIKVMVDAYRTAEIFHQRASELFAACGYHIVHYAGDCFFDSITYEQSGLGFWEHPQNSGEWQYLRTRELASRFRESQTLLFYLSGNVGAMIGDPASLRSCEYLGVMDALVQAGVPNVLGHRWPITASSACSFAEKFYERLFETQSPVRAAHYARCEMYNRDADDEIWMSSILVSQQLEQITRPY